MSRCVVIVAAIAALAACEPTNSGAGGPKVAESGTAKGSAGGFSAQMSAELAKAGIGEPAIPPVAPKPDSAGGSASGGGSSATGGSGGSSPATGGSGGGSPATGSGGGSPATGSGGGGSTGGGSTGAGKTDGKTEPAGMGGGGATNVTAVGAVKAPAKRVLVKPPADVAAIKFDLEPNWERDMGEAGTFSLVVKIPGTEDTRVFSVRYGYEDPSAPLDCDQYKKYLEDRGAMKVSLNRQRGAACYIEGTDKGGLVAYRYLLTYGGKRLMCHGSLYKDKDSAALGDLRDKVLQQAKKICETLAL